MSGHLGVTAGLFEPGTEDGFRSLGGVGRRDGVGLLVFFTYHVGLLERTLGVAHGVVSHTLVGEEIGALHLALRGYYTGEHVGIEFTSYTVPEEFLAGVDESIDIADPDTSTEMPEFLLVVIPGRVSLDIGLDMELLVELFEEDPFLKGPAGRLSDGIHIPSFGDDAVFDDTRVADEGVYTVGGHHRDRVPVVDGRSRVLCGLFAGERDYEEGGKRKEEGDYFLGENPPHEYPFSTFLRPFGSKRPSGERLFPLSSIGHSS